MRACETVSRLVSPRLTFVMRSRFLLLTTIVCGFVIIVIAGNTLGQM